MTPALAAQLTPVRAEQADVQAQADTDRAIHWARADAHRQPPYWPFAPLCPMQRHAQEAQQHALREQARKARHAPAEAAP